MTIEVRAFAGDQIAAHLHELARLRIAVFRAWPYLYAGDANNELDYLGHFARAGDASLIAAFDGSQVVGMATASPMAAQSQELCAPVTAAGIDVTKVCYFGESVLLPAYRGRGLGHVFFDEREAGARRAGAATAMFCAVHRPVDHPARPVIARSHDRFWTGRGYAPVSGLTCRMTWREISDAVERDHELQFWSRAL